MVRVSDNSRGSIGYIEYKLFGKSLYEALSLSPSKSTKLRDFTDHDWDKRLEYDSEICIYFLMGPEYIKKSLEEYNRQLEKFSTEIQKYPVERLNHLKYISKLYIKYLITLTNDMINSIKQYKKSGIFKIIHSFELKEILKLLKINLSAKSFDDLKRMEDSLHNVLKKYLPKPELIKDRDIRESIKLLDRLKAGDGSPILQYYKRLFNEDYN